MTVSRADSVADSFGLRHSSFIRHSSFGLRHLDCVIRISSLILLLLQSSSAGCDDFSAVAPPLAPADAQRSFQLADANLVIELVAAEPDVVSPVAIAWDRRGRMVVAEMIGYPSTAGEGRIRRLEDRDGDGRYEHATVFAEGLSFPTSVLPHRGGMLVTSAPDILYLKDTDGDGVADRRRIEWTGFGADSQQLRSNGLHWVMDNWIYGANGRGEGEIRRQDGAGSAISIRGRDFRFSPSGDRFESLTGRSQFGQAHDDWGNRFLSWNQVPIRHALLEPHYLERASQLGPQAVVNIASPNDLGRVFAVSPAPRTFNDERAFYYNATCGLTILRSDGLGDEYRGDAFFCESLYNVVVRRKLVPSGPTFVAEDMEPGKEFLASTDSWFHPVNLATGPDGALYIADFYREFVEHPRYVREELRGKFDWRNGYDRGRIWRIRRRDEVPVAQPFHVLQGEETDQLVALLDHPVGWWRDEAQRRLVELADPRAAVPLRRLVIDGTSPQARAHALWSLEGLALLDESTLVETLADANPRVREQAIRLAESWLAGSGALRDALQELADDPDRRVRFQLALTCGVAGPPLRDELLPALISAGEASSWTAWTALAVLSAAGPELHPLLSSIFHDQPAWVWDPSDRQARFLVEAGELLGRGGKPNDLQELMRFLAAAPPRDSPRGTTPEEVPRGPLLLLAGYARGLAARGESLRDVLHKSSPPHGTAHLSGDQVALLAVALVSDATLPGAQREAAVDLLSIGDRRHAEEVLETLVAEESAADRLRAASIRALCGLDRAAACRALYDDWEQSPLWYRRAVLQAAQESPAARAALVEALEDNVVVPLEIPLEVDAALRQAHGELGDRARAALARAGAADRVEVIRRFLPAAAMEGDRMAGARIFRKQCVACHTVQRFGHGVGPDLAAVAGRDPRELLVDILDPSRRVSPDYAGYSLITSSGRVYVGLIISEISGSVTLRREEAHTVTVERAEIDELRATGQSLMPVGFEQRMDVRQMADLLAFLQRPDRSLLED